MTNQAEGEYREPDVPGSRVEVGVGGVVCVVGVWRTLLSSTDELVQTPLIYSQEEPRHNIMRKEGFLKLHSNPKKDRCYQSVNYKS